MNPKVECWSTIWNTESHLSAIKKEDATENDLFSLICSIFYALHFDTEANICGSIAQMGVYEAVSEGSDVWMGPRLLC